MTRKSKKIKLATGSDFAGAMYSKMRQLAGAVARELISTIKYHLGNSADSVGGASHV